VNYIRENHLGYVETSPSKAVQKIEKILAGNKEFQLAKKGIKHENIKNGAGQIADFLVHF